MFKRTKVSTGVLLALGGAVMVAASVPAFAQDDTQRIGITGSRIASPNAESPSPLQVLTSEDIAASGATNIQELLLKNPTFGVAQISRTSSNFLTSSAGVATVDLRNLGTNRTLVLVNGRRFVSGIPGDTGVDLNAIPTDFIERIELLTGGASSTYGSDAVAGVVNIILKKNFEGLVFDASIGQSERGDDEKKKFSVTFGSNSANGKANLMGHFGYSDQGAVYSRDRSRSAIDQASVGAFVTGDPADFFKIQKPFFSGFAPAGRFYAADGSAYTFDDGGNLIPFSTNGPAGDGVGATGFNRSAFRTIAVPTERYIFAGTGDYAINDNHSAFFEGTYVATQTKSRLEPYPLASDDIYGSALSGGQVPAEFRVNGVIRRNPIVPDSLYNLLGDTDPDGPEGPLVGDGLRDYFFERRLGEVGTRGNVADRDTFRIVSGLKGDITKSWNYEAFVGYGATKESQTSSGQTNVLNFRNALEAIPDLDDIDGDGDTAEAICRDADAREQGCVPINVFGANSISPAALQYIQAPGSLITFTSQKIFGATVSGEPFMLPAGPLGVAAGVEYREEYSRSEFDALQQAGLNAGNAIPRTEGKFDVKELFAEVRLPLLKDQPFAKQLNVTGAVRGGKYSTVGDTLSWNAGVEWAPISDLKFRAVRALSTRAPNINELFSPPSQDFPTGLSDPCDGITNASTGVTAERCRAAPGVQANINADGVFNLSQADLQGVSGFNRGNPNVNEEEGNSWTAGVVFTPKGIPVLNNTSFTIDYFNIKIKDAIVSTPRQFILDQCYSGDTSFCQFITRRPAATGANSPGSLDLIDSGVTNSGNLVTEGVDLTAAYAGNVGPGRLNAKVAYTHLLEGYLTPLPGAPRDYFINEIEDGASAAKNKASLALGYNWGPFGIYSQTTYIGKMTLDDQFLAGFTDADGNPLKRGSITVKEKFYNDFQFTYTAGKVTYILGIDNAFDTKPNPIISGLPGNDTGTETDAQTYDPIGRRYYVGIRIGL